ncbi:hypothetical protein CORMATOL_02950 [Corynebacterium matruchotii ATCC 33806]|uniref:Uncharacterized protein n=1 Tax=Corynebacterium matruchotii ATCC 33806 TaxID=566549 RepID=C0E7G1_9CORY|nr:hypothetical protein CORMATOL_02950 [Corynebacterium matruchotii ATCC 33806]
MYYFTALSSALLESSKNAAIKIPPYPTFCYRITLPKLGLLRYCKSP